MSDPEGPGRRSSDVLDAIWDKVASRPERSDAATLLFRAKALEQLDVATEVDNQLPLVSRRSWLLLVGVGILVLAFALWASLTPSVTAVSAPGRVVAEPGVVPVAAPAAGVLLDGTTAAGARVVPGEAVATLRTESGDVAVVALVAGTLWQQPVLPGAVLAAGDTVVTLLPPASTDTALLAVPESAAGGILPGMAADVAADTPATGTVAAVSAPFDAEVASSRTGLALPPGQNYVIVTVNLAEPLTPGAAASGQVVLSDSTVFARLLGRS